MQIDYTALRSISAGHSEDGNYTINVDLSANKRSSKIEGEETKSLNLNKVVVVHAINVTNNLSTVLVNSSTTTTDDDMREFLDSVIAGEIFQLDLTGSLINYKLDSIRNPYTETEFDRSNFRYSFKVRAV